jgi:predicted flap endonuclease-1-like 5' DNA nuclease
MRLVMFVISQIMIFLLLALIVGGAIGYAFRACLADAACDDVRNDLALAQTRLQELEERAVPVVSSPVADLPPFPVQREQTDPAPFVPKPFVPEPIVTLADTLNGGAQPLPLAPEMARQMPPQMPPQLSSQALVGAEVSNTLAVLSQRELEAALLATEPGTSPKSRFEAEDLTAIKGLTPQMDRFLASFGITRLADITNLTASELYWLVENLPGDGASVYRDHWVAQATALQPKG